MRVENFQNILGIHSLDLYNIYDSNVATISSIADSSLINIYNNTDPYNYISIGTSNKNFVIHENNNNNGFIYNNNTIYIDNIKNTNIILDNIKYNTPQVIFPNNSIDISAYTFTSSGSVGLNFAKNLFITTPNTYWMSDSVFDGSGNLKTTITLPSINNIYIETGTSDSFKNGVWVTIKLPVSIILTSYHIEAVNYYLQFAPTHFCLYAFDYVLSKWRLLSENSFFDYNINNYDIYINIPSEKQKLYDTFTFLVSQVNGGLYAQINSLQFFAKPIISINDSIRITDDNIYNVNTLFAKELRLNNNSITTFDNLIDTISSGAILSVSSNITINWKNYSSNITYTSNNVGIYNNNPLSALSVSGDVSYNRRIIENSISIYPHPDLVNGNITIPRQSYIYSYITIGSLNFTINDYFHIDLYSIDFPIDSADYPYTTYYQKISIYGICNPSLKNSIYYDNIIDKSYLPIDTISGKKIERITKISYNYNQNNLLELYVKYNDLLYITHPTTPKNFSNIIYIDPINTRTNINNNFILNTTINYPSTGITPKDAIKNSCRILDLSSVDSNIFYTNYLSCSDSINTNSIYFTANNYSSNSILYTDSKGYIRPSSASVIQLNKINDISTSSNCALVTDNIGLITTTNVTTQMLLGLSNISRSFNNAIITDSNGLLTYSSTTNVQIEGLYNISFGSNKALCTNSNGIITYSSVSDIQLAGLSNASIIPNRSVITDNRGILTYGNVTSTQLNGLYNISYNSNNILTTNNSGIISATPVTYNMLIGLSNITSKTRRFVITDDNGYLTATNAASSNAENIDNILTLFNFSKNIASTYSNIVIGSNETVNNAQLYVKGLISTNNLDIYNTLSIGQGSLHWNSNLNVLEYNSSNYWKQFGDDILRCVAKYPPTFLYSPSAFITNLNTYQHIYTCYLNKTCSYGSGIYTIKCDLSDDGGTVGDNVNNTANMIFSDNSANYYWQTYPNFNNSTLGYINTKYIEENSIKYANTACGAYFIISLPENILLTYYNIYYNYNNTNYTYQNTLNTFTLFGYNINTDNWDTIDIQINVKKCNNNFIPNTFVIQNLYNNLRYSTFCICVYKTNTEINNNYAVINGFELYGINNYYGNTIYNISSISSNTINNTSNIYTKTFQNSPSFILGNNNVGINNYLPASLLSIGSDIYCTNNIINTESVVNINHSCNVDNLYGNGIRVLNLTRPSNNITKGIRASHVLNTWVNNADNLRTQYDIKLSHKNYENEKTVLSMLSDGRVGIGMTPDTSNYRQQGLSVLSNIYLYNNNTNTNYNRNFINIGVTNISSNYGIILPSYIGDVNNFLTINNITNNKPDEGNNIVTANLAWVPPNNIFTNVTFAQIGYPGVITCNVGTIKLQVAGSCIIGSNYINTIGPSYINQNTLIVTGQIYTTNDVTTDSDISYKYDLKKIDNAIEKISNLNGYTFSRNDVFGDDCDRRFCGLIAQEVEKVMPEAITKKHDNKLRVFYNNLAGLFVEGFKEHDDRISYMNYKINFLYIMLFSYIIIKLFI